MLGENAVNLLRPSIVFAVRQSLLLVPLAASLALLLRRQHERRVLVGACFAFLYQFGVMFALHIAAIAFGWWHYGGASLKLLGFPADIWLGGALLWGPVLFLAFPRTKPLVLVLPSVVVNAVAMPLMSPVIAIGPGWLQGQIAIVLLAMVPGQTLARWTAQDRHLPWRAALLAIAYAATAFFVVPSLIMEAMGGCWPASQAEWTSARMILSILPMLICMTIGLAAVQAFVLHGEGTPIPLDSTKRLVWTGLYSYLANPMQTSTALAWLVMGAVLGNPWIAAAAGMAVLFVLGMVRWHQRNDLAVRFPIGWPEYRAAVPDWVPLWRPWRPKLSNLTLDMADPLHARFAWWIEAHRPIGLSIEKRQGARLAYREPDEAQSFTGAAAVAKALNHFNLAYAFLSAGLLLAVLVGTAPLDLFRRARKSTEWPVKVVRAPSPETLRNRK